MTGSPSEATDLANWAASREINLLDGALLTYPKGIGGADSVVVYSGSSGVWQRQQPLLRTLAGGSEYLGEPARLANAMDHVKLSFITVAQTAMFTTLAYAEALGVPRSAAVGQVVRSLSTMRHYLEYAAPMLESGDFTTTEATIDTWVRSSRDFAQGQRDAGLTARVLEASAETIWCASEAGFGDLDLAAIYRYELELAGLLPPSEQHPTGQTSEATRSAGEWSAPNS